MKLYIVATPIGNLDDITFRAIEILRSVDFILCEDTRQTRKLLDHYKIRTRTISYHQHSKIKKINYILDLLRHEKKLALVSDAGTPGISDPGNQLISLAVKQFNPIGKSKISCVADNLTIVPIPGPSALTSALSISGFPTDKFVFYGFLPHKKGKDKILKQIIGSKLTSVIYESPYRIIKTLKRLEELELNKKLIVCRELTKKFETIYRGNINEILIELKNNKIKGEFVIVISSK